MGIPMPPNILSMGVPPPGMMMQAGPGMSLPGMPPMPPMDKSIPPPLNPPQSFAAMQAIPPPPPHISNSNINDDQMDIEMDDETTVNMTSVTDKVTNFQDQLMGFFNHPPPQILGQNMQLGAILNVNSRGVLDNFNSSGGNGSVSGDSTDKVSRERQRDYDRSDIGDRKNHDKNDNRDRTDRRGNFSGNRNDRDRERNNRWNGGRISNSRDRDSYSRDRDVTSKERERTLQDRLRELAHDGNNLNRNDYPRDGRRAEQYPSLLDIQLSDAESSSTYNVRAGGFNDNRSMPRQPPVSLLSDDGRSRGMIIFLIF